MPIFVTPGSGGGGGGGVNSVSGPNVDNTDPANPVVGNGTRILLTGVNTYTNLPLLGGKTPQIDFKITLNSNLGGVLKPDIATGGSYDFNAGLGQVDFDETNDYILEVF